MTFTGKTRLLLCPLLLASMWMMGCSSAPVADFLDCACTGKFRPKAGARPFGGVCLPQNLPGAVGTAVVPLPPGAPVVPGAPINVPPPPGGGVVPPPTPLPGTVVTPSGPIPPPPAPPTPLQ